MTFLCMQRCKNTKILFLYISMEEKIQNGALVMKVNNMHEFGGGGMKQCCFCLLGFCNLAFQCVINKKKHNNSVLLKSDDAKPKRMKINSCRGSALNIPVV